MLIWAAASVKTKSERDALVNDTLADLTNFSLLFEQDVLRTVGELDRVILYLRRTYVRGGYQVDWTQLLQEEFTVNSRTVQIAIIDERGKMITSTAMPNPNGKIDLSDREHFKFHKNSLSDVLDVSKPVIGRASGKWSIQFTRRFTKHDGSFGGVIVVSLDPSSLLLVYNKLEAQPSAGFVLTNKDDIILAGAGTYKDLIGHGLTEGSGQQDVATKSKDLRATRERVNMSWRFVAMRQVGNTGINVGVSLLDPSPTNWYAVSFHYIYAALLSVSILAAVLSSIRRQRHHVRHITQLAHADTLTKLPNRLSLKEALEAEFDAGGRTGGFVLHLIDLDRFKDVNDTYGHPVGDELLTAVAGRLKQAVRQADTVFRLGGDEFALIQRDCGDAAQAGAVAKRLCDAMAVPFEISGHRLSIGASIGIATTTANITDQVALLKAADLALYLAKTDGRGRYRYFDAELNAAHLARRNLETDLRDAVEAGQLEVHYQPKVLLGEANHVVGFEALVRWRHPKRGMLSPAEFIPIAEQSGLIIPMGEWLLQEVCAELALKPGRQTVAVNCSAIQFSRGNVVLAVERALSSTGLAPTRLEIEITESMLMNHNAEIVSQLVRLREMGIRVSLDDFGTGYSSLSYLEKYPIDCIKIDRSFVAKLGEEARAAPIIRAIIALAADLDMVVVAEGVETRGQADALAALGCTVAQGYLFGRPRSARETWPEVLEHALVA